MAARGVLGLLAVAALMGSAACGSVSAGSAGQTASAGAGSSGASSSGASAAAAGAPAGGSLCAAGRSADRVVVTRTVSPRQVTLSGATQVQAMVAALCALPATPSGQHCLVVSADSVRLVFAAGEQSFPPVSVQESGCRGVTGLGATRSWSPSSAFGRLLSEAVGGVGKLVPGVHPSSVPTGP
ncbi:MAG: hypothetical protein ACRDP5_00485 [Streptosporangiaceae bacterium]